MAVTISAAQLRVRLKIAEPTQPEIDAGVDIAADLLAVASELVNAYARNAPDAISNESCVRLCGWLKRGSAAPDSISISGTRLSWRPTPGRNALRSSGAAGLLAPWHRPRALVVENGS